MSRLLAAFCFFAAIGFAAVDADRDFTGIWRLVAERSEVTALPGEPLTRLRIEHDDSTIRVHSQDALRPGVLSYSTAGRSTKFTFDGAPYNCATKWEGAAFIVNAIVNSARPYTRHERWKLGRSRRTLTVDVQITRAASESEGRLVYERTDLPPAEPEKPQTELITRPAAPAVAAAAPPKVVYVVPAGTQIPLRLNSTVSTKSSRDGDRVYLTTEYPITINGKIVIPPGSAVSGTVTQVTEAGKVKGRGSLFLRFDSLTLPNGATRSLRSRPSATDATQTGTLDRAEGEVKGEGGKGGDARTVGTTTAAGAGVGSLGGGRGAAIGAAAGAAVGLGKVLFSRGPGATLAKGSVVEMTLDRDLSFQEDELK